MAEFLSGEPEGRDGGNFLSGGDTSGAAAIASLQGLAKPDIGPLGEEAEQAWEEMNKMLKEDPEQYKKFITEQMESARKEAEEREKNKPRPAICVESWGKLPFGELGDNVRPGLLVQDKRRVLISICGSDKVPPLSSTKDGSVPIVLREPVELPAAECLAWGLSEADQCIGWQAVFHSGVIVKAKREPAFKTDLISLCMECVQDKGKRYHTLDMGARRILNGDEAAKMHRLAGREGPHAPKPLPKESQSAFAFDDKAKAKVKKKKKKKRDGQPPRQTTEPAVLLPTPGAVKRWPAGTIVTVTGLKNAAQHNGTRGTIQSYHEEKGRYVVRLDSGEAIRLKPDNAMLEELPKTSSSSALLGVDYSDRHGSSQHGNDDTMGLAIPGAPSAPSGRSSLIQEVSSTNFITEETNTKDVSAKRTTTEDASLMTEVSRVPRYTLQRNDTGHCIVTITLPGRKNGKDIDLSVSATLLEIGVPSFDTLVVKLPVVVDTAEVKAKFVKSSSSLRVTLRVVSEHAGWDNNCLGNNTTARQADSERQARAQHLSGGTLDESSSFLNSLAKVNPLN